MERQPAGRATDLTEPLRRVAELARKRGLIVLISDLLAPVGRTWRRISPASPPPGTNWSFSRCSIPTNWPSISRTRRSFGTSRAEQDIYIDPAAVRASYQRRLREHGEGVEAVCRKLGFAFHRIMTDRPLDLALLDFLRSRVRRGKLIRRRSQRTST